MTKKHPDKIVLFQSTENFTNCLQMAISKNTFPFLKNYYRKMDVLILDDINYLEGKEKTQEIITEIFDYFLLNEKQIILSIQNSPGELPDLEKQLLSRFRWGITTNLEAPEFETRMAILSKKSSEVNLLLSFEIMEYISSEITTNIRELEGITYTINAHALNNKRPITLELAKQVILKITGLQK